MPKSFLDELTIEEQSRINFKLLTGGLVYIPWVDKQVELFRAWKPRKIVPVKDIDFTHIRDRGELKAYVELRSKLEAKGHPTHFPFLSSDERYAENFVNILISQNKKGTIRSESVNFYSLSPADAEGFLRYYPKNEQNA